MKTTYAWHFTGPTLRDGSPIPPIGQTLRHSGRLVPCKSGLHASLEPFDALQFAPGPQLHLVRVDGRYLTHNTDKIVADNRTIVASMDATDLLGYFARMQALSVAHLWDVPDVTLDFLMTGDSLLQAAARAAARDAARAAARAAARDAAWGAAWDAARDAAWDAAWGAAWDAAWDAARDAAWAAAWGAAWDAARDAAWAAARDAARKEFNLLVYEAFEGPLGSIK